MKQVFTDERFPGFEVHNDGTPVFHVFEVTEHSGPQEVDTFRTFHNGGQPITPEMAKKQADAYFQRQASNFAAHEDMAGDPLRSRPPVPEFPRSKSLNDLMGGNILSADDVMEAYETASAIADPAQRERALQQVRQMSARFESAADEIVRNLID